MEAGTEELIRGIIGRVRAVPDFNHPLREWRVAVAEEDGAWTARLLSFNVESGEYHLVQAGDTEATFARALARLDRRVELMRYKWELQQSAKAHAASVRERHDAMAGDEGAASHDATGAPESH